MRLIRNPLLSPRWLFAIMLVASIVIGGQSVAADPTTAPDLSKTSPANTASPAPATTRTSTSTPAPDLSKNPANANQAPAGQSSLGNFEAPNIECKLQIGGDCTDLNAVLVFIAEWLIGIAGTLFFFMFLYGAMRYLTGAGDESQTEKAKKTLLNAGVGLVIVLSAWAIVELVVRRIGG